MKHFIFSALGLLAAGLLSSKVKADLDKEENFIAGQNYRAVVGYGHAVAGDRCFGDEVMTGFRNGQILCSNIQVNCN